MATSRVTKAFGQRLRAARLNRNWTQEDLADKAGLHFTYIGQAERGLRNITLQSLEKIAKALKVKGGDLLPF